jgi:predicted kinase
MDHAILIRGALGVGKSTVSAQLARDLGGLHVSIDAILERENLEEWDEGRIGLRSFLRANEFALRSAGPVLAAGRSVVFDGNFYWTEAIRDLRTRLPCPLRVFLLEAPISVCIERDRARPSPRDPGRPVAGESMGEQAVRDVYRLVAAVPLGTPVDACGSPQEVVAAVRLALTHPSSEP